MKRFLITGGILFAVMPAMALNLPDDLITASDSLSCSDTQNQEFAESHDAQNPLQMKAIYVKNACQSGQYLSVTGNTVNIDNSGNITNADCTTCTAGYYCDGLSDITINNNQLQSSYGISECPAGYTDGGTGAISIYGCQKKITSCSDYAANFTLGTMTPATLPSGGLLVNYRDISNHCFGSLNCNTAGYTTKKNVYQIVAEHPEMLTASVSCPIDGTITHMVYNSNTDSYDKITESCSSVQEPGTVKVTLSGDHVPMATANFVGVCSDKVAAAITYGSADYNSLTAESTGPNCYMRNVDFPNQPWFMTDTFSSIGKCEEDCPNMGDAYPLIQKKYGANNTVRLIVKDSSDNYYLKNGNQFVPLTVIPADACYDGNGGLHSEYLTSSDCTTAGYMWNKDSSYFMDTNATPVDNIGDYTYVLYDGIAPLFPGLAQMTASDTNVQVCVANTVNINWDGVNNPGDAGTCTYGESFTAPATGPTPSAGYKFLGWKVGTTNNN